MARISKQDAKQLLAEVPEKYVFRCCDGRIVRSMREIENAFIDMTDETFAFHSTEGNNDFSNWVRDVIRDEKLAKDISKSLNRAQAAKSVLARTAFLDSKVAQGTCLSNQKSAILEAL